MKVSSIIVLGKLVSHIKNKNKTKNSDLFPMSYTKVKPKIKYLNIKLKII